LDFEFTLEIFSINLWENIMKKPRKTAYVALSVDFIHPGHLNIINKAHELGDVIIGLITDEAIVKYKRMPILTYDQRRIIAENIKGVIKVVPQNEVGYLPNLKELKPDYVVHGDDWKTGPLQGIRQEVIDFLETYGGKLIEPAYTEGLSSSSLKSRRQEIGTTPEIRKQLLRRLLRIKPLVRVLEAHNGLTGLIVENTTITNEEQVKEFDATWISSLTDSIAKGKPDIGYVDFTSRLTTINEILDVTTKPIIVDGDSGGHIEHFVFMVKTLERLGVSAIIIEDKIGLKKNSLLGTEVIQTQDTVEHFCEKICAGKKAQVTHPFMIIARIESLILEAGMEDALIRAKAYIEAGSDAIMIHSKSESPQEILEFCKRYSKFETKVPLVAVPTTYNKITEKELEEAGVRIVIYANHLLRSSYPAMVKTAQSILNNERSYETNDDCLPIRDILHLIPGGDT
jgi:phosphoenolpyruvate phosphomutase